MYKIENFKLFTLYKPMIDESGKRNDADKNQKLKDSRDFRTSVGMGDDNAFATHFPSKMGQTKELKEYW